MSDLVELVIEGIFTIAFEFSFDILSSNRVRNWVKVPVFIVFFLVNSTLPAIFITFGVHQYTIGNMFLALIFFAMTFIYIIVIYKVIRKKISEGKTRE